MSGFRRDPFPGVSKDKLEGKLTTAQFFALLEKHDWTYNMSDDHSVWTAGLGEEAILKKHYSENPLFKKMYQEYYRHVWTLDGPRPPKPRLEDY